MLQRPLLNPITITPSLPTTPTKTPKLTPKTPSIKLQLQNFKHFHFLTVKSL